MIDPFLRRALGRRAAAQWPEDYDVIGPDGDVIGRIFKATTPPTGRPWAWTLASGQGGHGFGLTREAVIQALAKSWRQEI